MLIIVKNCSKINSLIIFGFMKRLFLLVLVLSVLACEKPEPQKAQVKNLEDIAILTGSSPEKIQVINFWATWCKPCVDELPAFEKLQDNFQDEIEVILISLDDVENLDSNVNPFLATNNIQSQVWLLNHPYAAEYIPMVDQHWDGAIPVTLIKHKTVSKFFNQEFQYPELEYEVELLLKK